MIVAMKLRFVAFYCWLILLASPVLSLADDLDVKGDARLEGYNPTARLESNGVAMGWLLLIALGVVALAVLFKDAKRSHLD